MKIEDNVGIKPRKRNLEETEMDITPMIDITFLLLIFFLVASKMDQPAPVALPPAKNGTAVGIKNSILITIKEGENGDAKIYKGSSGDESRLLKSGDLAEQEAEIVAYVEAESAENLDKTAVLVSAEKAVKHRDVGRVAKAVGKVGAIQQLHVAVMETN
jgi:biopolymer transport protein ExbD